MSSSQQPPAPAQAILLFARGVVAILDLWPALSIAVTEQWGGPESAEKRTWMASTIIDEWEQRTSYLPSQPDQPLQVDPADAKDPALDLDDLGDLLNQMITDEFDAKIEDGSIDSIANDMIRLWHDLLIPPTSITPERIIVALEEKAASRRKSGVRVSKGGDIEEVDEEGDSESDSDEDMEVDQVPQLVPREPKEKQEPVVDDDGFTLVQTKGRKGR